MGAVSPPPFARQLALMSGGVVVWALHFGALYGGTALACARGMAPVVPVIVGAATLLAVLLLVPMLMLGLRRRHEFEGWLGGVLAAFALVAVLWEALPVLIVEACA